MFLPDPLSALAPSSCEVLWAGERLCLLPERALWWPAQHTVFVADLHLGKAATYRALGQPVPGGTTRENLARLDALIATRAPRHLVFLGDFLHAAQARTAAVLAALHGWRARHAGVAMTLVRGNHDSRAGDPPATLAIRVVDEPLLMGPFACCHHPKPHVTHHVLAGHEHPVCGLRGQGRDGLRLPCFVARDGLSVLPAFGEFTGGWSVSAAEGQRLYAVGGGRVWALPDHPAGRTPEASKAGAGIGRTPV